MRQLRPKIKVALHLKKKYKISALKLVPVEYEDQVEYLEAVSV